MKEQSKESISPAGENQMQLHHALDHLLHTRRAVYPKSFTADPLPEGALEQLLTWANRAPSHRHTEPWRFAVVQGSAREALGEYLVQRYTEAAKAKPDKPFDEGKVQRMREKAQRSQAVIGILQQRDPAERVPEWEELAAMAMAVQNLWLGVRALGLGGYWSSPRLITEDRRFFDLAEGERCYGLFYLGCVAPDFYSTQLRPSPRGDVAQKTRYVQA